MSQAGILMAVLGLLFAAPEIGQAATYWVSVTGSASWEDAQSVSPLDGAAAASLATANAHAQAGDVVLPESRHLRQRRVHPPGNSGTSENNRIVFSSYNGETVTITEAAYGIYLYKKSFISVNAIDFFSLRRFMRIYAGHHNDIGYCNFDTRSASSGDWVGALIADDYNDATPASENSTYNRVHHCTFLSVGLWGF